MVIGLYVKFMVVFNVWTLVTDDSFVNTSYSFKSDAIYNNINFDFIKKL